jgi:selenocysteine lyase/cysteine desulfurase
MSWIERYEETLSKTMLNGTDGVQGMKSMKGVEVYGSKDPSQTNLRVPTFTFNIIGADSHRVAEYLWDKHAVAILAEDAGGFYSRTLKTFGKSIAVRASLAHFNTVQEVETFLLALADTAKQMAA